MQLFFPTQAAARWHAWVWLALAVLYVLALLMFILSCKPRLIAYGMTESQFQNSLLSAAQKIDQSATWNGDVLTLPHSDIQLALEPSGTFRVHQVIHVGVLRNLQDWLELERAFVRLGASITCPRSTAGWPFVIGGMLLLGLAVLPLLSDPNTALAQLREFLDR
jgi:hypothetical protein